MSKPSSSEPDSRPPSAVKEILTSITIAFVMAFVFRGFVVEGYVIPTGSMAPTLMGEHMRLRSDASGYDWPVGPWHYYPNTRVPKPVQGTGGDQAIRAADPMTRFLIDGATGSTPLPSSAGQESPGVPTRAGDRVFVLKYLNGVYEPQRWHVVVFKNPQGPSENYIKRLIGLPGEQVVIIDGDVFTRPAVDTGGAARSTEGVEAWGEDSWQIARKPERVQRELWYPLFDSTFTPDPDGPAGLSFRSPWLGDAALGSWDQSSASYRFEASGAESTATLRWDTDRWPLTDLVSYNIVPQGGQLLPHQSLESYHANPLQFPVSDVRSSFGIEPDADGLRLEAILDARGHRFRIQIAPGEGAMVARFSMRPMLEDGTPGGDWESLGSSEPFEIPAGAVTDLDAWFVDQGLELWVDGARVGLGTYDWTPAQRAAFSTGVSLSTLVSADLGSDNALARNRAYRTAEFRWSIAGGSFTLHRVSMARDMHYQATPTSRVRAWGTHPNHFPTLEAGQYFVCGDNSARSEDSRLMTRVEPWVQHLAGGDLPTGVVPEHLMLGRAWVVYLPSPLRDGWFRLSLDFGRMRWIW